MKNISCCILFLGMIHWAAGQQAKVVSWRIEAPELVKPGDTVQLAIILDVTDGWHIYATGGNTQQQQMQATSVAITKLPNGWERLGKLRLPSSSSKGGNAVYLGKGNTFIQTIVVGSELPPGPGPLFITGKLSFQACNALICYPPVTEQWERQINIYQPSSTNTASGFALADTAWEQLQRESHLFRSEAEYNDYLKLPFLPMKRFEDSRYLSLMGKAERFLMAYPNDTRYPEALSLYLHADPLFIAERGNEALDTLRAATTDWPTAMRRLVIDTLAYYQWINRGDSLVAAISRGIAPAEDKETAAFKLLARDFRLAARNYRYLPQHESERDYWTNIDQIYWRSLMLRFNAHVDQFGDHPVIADRALDFLSGLKGFAPAIANEYWKNLAQSDSIAIRGEDRPGWKALHQVAQQQLRIIDQEQHRAPLTMSFISLDKKLIDLEKWRGKMVLIDFWASWCLPCVEELPRLKSLYDRYRRKGLEIVGICLDDEAGRDKAKNILAKAKVTWPQRFEGKGFSDDQYRKRYGISALPTVWLLDRSGKIIEQDARGEKLQELLERYLNQ